MSKKKAQQSSSDHDPLESTSLSLSSLDLKTSKSCRVNFGPWWSSGSRGPGFVSSYLKTFFGEPVVPIFVYVSLYWLCGRKKCRMLS